MVDVAPDPAPDAALAPSGPAELDLDTLSALGDSLYAEALAELDFTGRFADFGATEVPEDLGVVLRPGERAAAATAEGVRRYSPGQVLATKTGVHVVFRGPMDPDVNSHVVGCLVDQLAEPLWFVLSDLFAVCGAVGRGAPADAITAAFGPGDVRSAVLATGVEVMYHADALAFRLLGSTRRQFVEDEDKRPAWHLVITLTYAAVLRPAGARRLYAQGPGAA